jgi:hypothetical protein
MTVWVASIIAPAAWSAVEMGFVPDPAFFQTFSMKPGATIPTPGLVIARR